MKENLIQINGGIIINVDVIVRNVINVKEIKFGNQVYVIVKMGNF